MVMVVAKVMVMVMVVMVKVMVMVVVVSMAIAPNCRYGQKNHFHNNRKAAVKKKSNSTTLKRTSIQIRSVTWGRQFVQGVQPEHLLEREGPEVDEIGGVVRPMAEARVRGRQLLRLDAENFFKAAPVPARSQVCRPGIGSAGMKAK